MASENEIKKKLNQVNKNIEIEKHNLIFMLKNINIENINLINFHYKINDLLIKRHELENKLYYEKTSENDA